MNKEEIKSIMKKMELEDLKGIANYADQLIEERQDKDDDGW